MSLISVINCVNYIIIHVLFLLIFFLYTIHFKSYILIMKTMCLNFKNKVKINHLISIINDV
jgi:hypothetical protein